MSPGRWGYRVRQFFETLFVSLTSADLELVRQTLTPAQVTLFIQLQPSEQVHAVRVLRAIQENCQANGLQPPADLLVAALLHDIGKALYPLRIWERVVIVLGKKILPESAARWGNGRETSTATPRGWGRPFVIAAQHPAWGAEMAARQGTSPRAVALIRRHQDPFLGQGLNQSTGLNQSIGLNQNLNEEDRLLAILQAVDDES
jgi:putative nucleotidyltransferase with HDIG domain